MPSPACSLVKYSGWQEIKASDLGLAAQLDLAPVFITRMRCCTVLAGAALVLLLLAFLFSLLGHCGNDNKTLVASGMFILGALLLGAGLVLFASALSETLLEATQYHKESLAGPSYDYRYGWCFFTAGAAFVMTKMAAVFSLTGYLNRFPSVDEMVRVMVPGAERKLREHQRLAGEYMERHLSPQTRQQYDPICTERPKYEAECGPLLNKTPPDVCTTNKCIEFASAGNISGTLIPGVIEQSGFAAGPVVTCTSTTAQQTTPGLAGQTVPITIKSHHHHHHHPHHHLPPYPANFSSNKYGTMPHPGTTLHQGFLGVSEVGSSSSNSSSSYCSKSKTLQHQRPRKKCVKIETFQTPETGFADFSSKRSSAIAYSGSAV
ncbi:PREDICTED: uncharacterized protein LOC108566916 [Nicrophorus vespilloides]|uniref:Uncharacterized protein LOC108566916 n=1 Tax=Nicrophorus vespilloides TaxID=110193 RepID=A0ABM1N6U0_NICVS|nr:PREDICTED: uncharacterized protein LOC108566916 [Nicrophorus vespilloides]